jgi:hypothetical protein
MYRWCLFLLMACWCCSSGCGKSAPAKQREILAIREMSELATAEYIITKIIKASDDQTWYKAGDRKILMSCRAYIKAGIDLSAISEDNIHTDGRNITIQIPQAKIISLNMPPEDIVLEYQDIDLLRSPFKSSERDALAAQAEVQIKNGAEATGILQTAEANAKSFLTDFLQHAGYTGITINTGNTAAKPKKD